MQYALRRTGGVRDAIWILRISSWIFSISHAIQIKASARDPGLIALFPLAQRLLIEHSRQYSNACDLQLQDLATLTKVVA